MNYEKQIFFKWFRRIFFSSARSKSLSKINIFLVPLSEFITFFNFSTTSYDNDCAVSVEIFDENGFITTSTFAPTSTSTSFVHKAGSDFDKCGFEVGKTGRKIMRFNHFNILEKGENK